VSRAGALAQAVAILLEREQQDSTSRVDLCISLRVCDVDASGPRPRYVPETDEQLIEVGGVWNKRSKRWEPGESETLMVIRIPRGSEQEPAARYVAEWLRRIAIGPKGPHWEDFHRVWTLLLEGGRRGGKSHLSVVTLVTYAVMIPNALVWAVSPTNDETDELEGAIRSLLPGDWYTFRGGGGNRASQFKLPNGSRILLISGHKPRALKRGKVDLVLYNEGQNMSRAGWIQLRGAVADSGGMVIVACNPPDSEIGRWIEELHENARAGKIRAVAFHMTAQTNPFVQAESLEDMSDEVDDLTYRREVKGEFVPIGDTVMHAWSDSASVLDDVPAHWIDVTARETKRELGRAAGYATGMDFQQTPHMPAAVERFYTDPKSEDPDEVIGVVVDEVVCDDANEDELIDALEAMPRYQGSGLPRVEGDCYHGQDRERITDPGSYAPKHCAVVMDASAWWQDGEHHKGRTSDRKLRARGWIHLYRPQKDSDRNPEIVERVKVSNARLKSADKRDSAGKITKPGRRRFFVLKHCTRTIKAMRSWENKNGIPNRRSDFAHICDAVTYVIFRFFGKPATKRGHGGYDGVGGFDRAGMFPR